jgi:tetratricopeptide (TPR) repeat protein
VGFKKINPRLSFVDLPVRNKVPYAAFTLIRCPRRSCTRPDWRISMKKTISFVGAVFLICTYSVFASASGGGDFFGRGIAEFKVEKYEEALVLFERAYKENPNDPRITSYLGLTHREMHNYSEAVRFFKKTLELDPRAVEVKFLLADVLFGIANYEEALTIVESAIKEGVRPAQSNYLKGLILVKLNRNTEAVSAFKKAKELDPALTQQADFQIAAVHVKEREFKKAQEIFRGLIAIDPTTDWGLFSQDYLEALKKMPPPYRLNVGFGIQYDDNVLTTPLDGALVDIARQADWKKLFSLFGEYTFFQKGPWNIKSSYSLRIAQHNERYYTRRDGRKQFNQDSISHTFSLMPSYNTEKSVTSLLLAYNHLAIDSTDYKEAFTANPSYTFIISGNHLGQVSLTYRNDEYDRGWHRKKFGPPGPRPEEDRDADYFSAGLGYFYTFSEGNGLFNMRIEGNINDADGRNWKYRGYKVSAGLLYPFINNRLKANIFGEVDNQDFSEIHTIYRREKRNDTYTVQTALTYTIMNPLDVTVGYTHIKNDSNIGVYEYRKNLYTISFEYRFF